MAKVTLDRLALLLKARRHVPNLKLIPASLKASRKARAQILVKAAQDIFAAQSDVTSLPRRASSEANSTAI